MITDIRHYKHFLQESRNLNDVQIDEDIRPLIESFNKIDGVVTVFSCSGHPAEYPRVPKFYIVFALTSDGAVRLLQIYDELTHRYRKTRKFEFPMPDLKVSVLKSPMNSRKRWTGLSLEYEETHDRRVGVDFRQVLIAALESVVRDHLSA